ncbi:hypothetical protein QVD17_28481 [Tagetes erecta]|uniref:F-box domain-containing protein n=1 Tax=Tagetes erecta TaxID=13708 RepID=A0AAD8KDF4_TARER|nr:hypothetical protein QVD17_28481 [Tagetes erecta]
METIVGGNSSEVSSSSTHAVISNDDLLIEILFRLPIFSLHLFKSVSKRWLTLITDPNFTLRRTQNLTLNAPSDVEGSYLYKLDVEDQSSVTSIQTPTTSSDGTLHCYRKLFESRGCLLLVCTKDDYSMHMDIFEKRKGCFGWLVKYIVNLDDFMIRFPRKTPKWFCSSVGCIVVGNDEEDSFLVMEIYGKIVRYKLASKTIICDQLNEFEYSFYQRCFQFIASNADV